MRYIIVLCCCVCLLGCAAVTAQKITNADTQGKFRIGMPFNEVVALIGRQPSTFADIYEVNQKEDGEHKRWFVNGKSSGGNMPGMMRYYDFEFVNDKLVSWTWKE